MATAELEARKRARRSYRELVALVIVKLESELEKETADLGVLRSKMAILDDKFQKLRELDQRIEELMLDGTTSHEDLTAEVTEVAEVEESVIEIRNKVEPLIFEMSHPESTRSENGSEASFKTCRPIKEDFKLPRMELKKFTGELSEYLSWWSQFKVVHNSARIDNDQKYQLLMQSLVPGSRAMEAVQAFPQEGSCYDDALAALKFRFGKDSLLIEFYSQQLWKIGFEHGTGKTKLPLPKLFDQLNARLQSLKQLGGWDAQNGMLLYSLVTSCLSTEVLCQWEHSPRCDDRDPADVKLEELMRFLRKEVECQERLDLVKSGFAGEPEIKKKPGSSTATAASLVMKSDSPPKCVFCDGSHASRDCSTEMAHEDRLEKLKTARACFGCFRFGHQSKKCKTAVPNCDDCKKRHFPILCPSKGDKRTKVDSSQKEKAENVINCLGAGSRKEVPLATLKVKLIGPAGKKKVVRALIDTGCSHSTVLSSTAAEVGYDVTPKLSLSHTLYGGSVTVPVPHGLFRASVCNLEETWRVNFDAIDERVICKSIPAVNNKQLLQRLKSQNVVMTDTGNEDEIEVVLGNDAFGKLLTGKSRQIKGTNISAVETYLGWFLSGNLEASECTQPVGMLVRSMLAKQAEVHQLWELDVLGIKDPIESKSQLELEEETKQFFRSTVKVNQEGRYEIKLPFVMGDTKPPNNRYIAEKRLESATKKLEASGHFEAYGKIFCDWVAEGIVEVVPENEKLEFKAHYLPHHAVIKESSSTTKIRPVFNASCKTNKSFSLNDCLAKGPSDLESITAIVLQFRMRQVGAVSDIAKAFLQISIDPDDRDYLRFLWWEDDRKTMRIYRHRRVVFGVNCSPFLLSAVIEKHLRAVADQKKANAELLLRSFYVDNCVVSLDSLDDYKKFKDDAVALMGEAKMDLRLWEHSLSGDEVEVRPESGVTNVLGLSWDKGEDQMFVQVKGMEAPEKITKRAILSVAHSLFDPIGLVCPVSLEPKLLLRQATTLELGWDEEVPEEIKSAFEKWLSEVHLLSHMKIPRRLASVKPEEGTWSLHVFVDASKEAYAVAVYIRVQIEDQVEVQLIQAKSRVAPVKKATIPRLELMACVIGSRLAATIKKASGFDWKTTYWSDSATALTWIRKHESWGVFVNNRVVEIRKSTSVSSWRHVPGVDNPADLPSRGCSAKKLLSLNWSLGPSWLKNPENEWPVEKIQINEEEVEAELKKTVTSYIAADHKDRWYLKYFSRYWCLVRMLAWIRRLRVKSSTKGPILSATEVEEAERALWRVVQTEAGVPGLATTLKLRKDDDGLYVVETKITNRQDLESFKYPVYLPYEHPVTEMYLRQLHRDHYHVGTQTLMALARERVWIPKVRILARKIVSRCCRCRRFNEKKLSVPDCPLPATRVSDGRVFQTVGVDLTGPLHLKDGSTVHLALFTCAVYRAVHLELVDTLTNEDFLMALRRFIGRRGRPETILSDQATNFKGLAKLFKRIDWEKILVDQRLQKITWKFNVAAAPWWGGFYERIIGSIKKSLRNVLGKAVVDNTELGTMVVEVEAIQNSRPLTYQSEDQDDFQVLTPQMFITDVADYQVQDLDLAEGDLMRRRFEYRNRLRDELRSRFRKEYLAKLVQHNWKKDNRSLKTGDVVLIGSELKKRIDWPLARVIQTFPGLDGAVRVVKLKTKDGEYVRAVQKLYPLELESVKVV